MCKKTPNFNAFNMTNVSNKYVVTYKTSKEKNMAREVKHPSIKLGPSICIIRENI